MGLSSGIASNSDDPFSEIVVHHNSFKVTAYPTKQLRGTAAHHSPTMRRLSWQPRRPSMIYPKRFSSPEVTTKNRIAISPPDSANTSNTEEESLSLGHNSSSTTESQLAAEEAIPKKKMVCTLRSFETAPPLSLSPPKVLYVNDQNGESIPNGKSAA